MFLSGCQGGLWFFTLIDYYAAALSLMILAFFEVVAITWFYGELVSGEGGRGHAFGGVGGGEEGPFGQWRGWARTW